MIHILTVIGARPQFIKAAVVSRLIRTEPWRDAFRETLIHTGQHYDENMSEVFFRELRIPEPDVNLDIGSGSHGHMTGRMLARLEEILKEYSPDIVLVYGDTNSTLAGALAASKLLVPVAHVEAGLRSYSKRMPEEQNRILADHLSTWLFCPTDASVENLAREGFASLDSQNLRPSSDNPRVSKVGDVMYDASLFYRGIAAARPAAERPLARLGLVSPFRLLTLHRAENTDHRERLSVILEALRKSDDLPILFPLHPRTRKMMDLFGLKLPGHVRVIDPVGFLDMLELEQACDSVITDSGGVQKEAFFFGKSCVTLRDQTEWTETVDAGWNRLAGADPRAILEALSIPTPRGPRPALYGGGTAGEQILRVLSEGEAPRSGDLRVVGAVSTPGKGAGPNE